MAATLVRAAIGWHFLYEGFSKLVMEDWSAKAYLAALNKLLIATGKYRMEATPPPQSTLSLSAERSQS